MSEILIEKLELVLDEFEKLNGNKLDAYSKKVDGMAAKLGELQLSLQKMRIPEELKVKHEHLNTIEYRNTNVWVKVMGWVTGITIVTAVVFCCLWKYNYNMNEETVRVNAARKADYEWLYSYYEYMRKEGAVKPTATYVKENKPPE